MLLQAQHRLSLALRPAQPSNAVSLGSTLIQRLGSEHYGLLIGSRRTVGGTVLRGDGTRARAEVVTTASSGDGESAALLACRRRASGSHPKLLGCGAGTVELGSPLLWAEALHAWTARTGDAASQETLGLWCDELRERDGSRRRDDL